MFSLNTQRAPIKRITPNLNQNIPQPELKKDCCVLEWFKKVTGSIGDEGATGDIVSKKKSRNNRSTLYKSDQKYKQELAAVKLERDNYFEKLRTIEYLCMRETKERAKSTLKPQSYFHEILTVLRTKRYKNPENCVHNYNNVYESDDDSDDSIVLYEYRKK